MFVKLSIDVKRNVTSIVPFQNDCSTEPFLFGNPIYFLKRLMCPLEQSEQGFPIQVYSKDSGIES